MQDKPLQLEKQVQRKHLERRNEKMEQHRAVYEPPMLVEVGDFSELTRGFGSAEFDAFDYLSGFCEGW